MRLWGVLVAKDNERFGYSPGPYKAIEPIPVKLKLFSTGLNLIDGPMDLQDTEAVDMNNVRIVKGGIAPDFGLSKLG